MTVYIIQETVYLENLGFDGRIIFSHVSKKEVSYAVMNYIYFLVISGIRREVNENCTPLGYYAVSSGNSLPTFRDNLFPLHAA